MSLSLKLYERMPPVLQTAMTTLRGLQLRRMRYTSDTWKTFEALEASQWWSEERFREDQSRRLVRLVRHAYETVPWYRERFRLAGIVPGDVRGLQDLERLPILKKDEFRANNERFVSDATPRKAMWVAYTSGTSGVPLTAYFTHRNMRERIALLERFYHWYNPHRWRRRASFTGKLVVNVEGETETVCRANHAIRQWLFSSHHLSERHFPLYLRDLARVAPEQVDGILSPIYVVAQYLLASGNRGAVRPHLVAPTSETLWDFMRKTISEAFGCKVGNQYGSQEGAPVAYECPEGTFHTCPESGIFEVLNADGSPCPAGKVGRLVVTSFVSEGTPLIRYDIGDVASLSDRVCPCGRRMPALGSVHGRADDMFFTRARGVVTRVDSAFKSMPSAILATQVAQVAIDRFEVRVAVDPGRYRAEYGEELVQNLHLYLGGDVEIRLVVMDRVPVTPGGKVRAMVNECRSIDELREIREGWDRLNQA